MIGAIVLADPARRRRACTGDAGERKATRHPLNERKERTMSTNQADLICELRAGARGLDGQHALSLAAGILHDAVNDGRADADATREPGTTDSRLNAARVAAALGAAREAAYGTASNDPDWTGATR